MPIKKKVTQIAEDQDIDKNLNKRNEKDNSENEWKKWYKQCPYCGEEIDKRAVKCQYCKKFLYKAKKECPFCFNEIDEDLSKCPFCDEVLEIDDDNKVIGDDEKNCEEESDDESNSYKEDKKYGKKYVCDACKWNLGKDDEVCPHCGKSFDERDKSWIQLVLVLFFLIVIVWAVISYFSN